MWDGDRYYLQYRTAGDAKVRPTHAEMAGITLPASDPFWAEFYPPNGWAAAVPWSRYANPSIRLQTTKRHAARGNQLWKLTKGNVPVQCRHGTKDDADYNPYTIKRCKDCDMNNGNMKLVFVPENELCAACKLVRTLANADAKQIKSYTKPSHLQGTVITNNEFPFR